MTSPFGETVRHIIEGGLWDHRNDIYWLFVGRARATIVEWDCVRAYQAYGEECCEAQALLQNELAIESVTNEKSLLWQARHAWKSKHARGESLHHFYYRASSSIDLDDILFQRVEGSPLTSDPTKNRVLFPKDSAAVLFFIEDEIARDKKVLGVVVMCLRGKRLEFIARLLVGLQAHVAFAARRFRNELQEWQRFEESASYYEAMWNLLVKFDTPLSGVPFASDGRLHNFEPFRNCMSHDQTLKDFYESFQQVVRIATNRGLNVTEEQAWRLFLKPLYTTAESMVAVRECPPFNVLWGDALARWPVIIEDTKTLAGDDFATFAGISITNAELITASNPLKLYAPLDLQFRFFAPLADLVIAIAEDAQRKQPDDSSPTYRLQHSEMRRSCSKLESVREGETTKDARGAKIFRAYRERTDYCNDSCERRLMSYTLDILYPPKFGFDLCEIAHALRLGPPKDHKTDDELSTKMRRVQKSVPPDNLKMRTLLLSEMKKEMAWVAELVDQKDGKDLAGVRISWHAAQHEPK